MTTHHVKRDQLAPAPAHATPAATRPSASRPSGYARRLHVVAAAGPLRVVALSGCAAGRHTRCPRPSPAAFKEAPQQSSMAAAAPAMPRSRRLWPLSAIPARPFAPGAVSNKTSPPRPARAAQHWCARELPSFRGGIEHDAATGGLRTASSYRAAKQPRPSWSRLLGTSSQQRRAASAGWRSERGRSSGGAPVGTASSRHTFVAEAMKSQLAAASKAITLARSRRPLAGA